MAENPTPADLAQQAADKAEEAQHHADNGDYTQAGEALDAAQAKADEYDKATDLDTVQKRLAEAQRDLEKARNENRKLKDENGERRVKAKQAEEQQAAQLKKVLQVLGIEPEEDDPEQQIKAAQKVAEERARERDELQAELDRMRATDRLRTLTAKHGGDADKLVPYLRGTGELPQWGDDEWDSKVGQLITDTLTRYPEFGRSTHARTSGNQPNPTRNNDGPTLSVEDITRMTEAGEYEEVNKAVREGRVKF